MIVYLPTFKHLRTLRNSVYTYTVRSRSNWNLEMLVFEERGKPEYPEKILSEQGENQQQTQPTYGAGSENRTQAALVGVECSRHCTTPVPRFAFASLT